MNYDQEHAQYMTEVKDYLAKVANGRRVGHVNPDDRRFNQNSEDQRQAKALGVPYTPPPQATAPYSQALSPQYGFTPTPRPAWAPYADMVGQALNDPRNQAMFAPGMSLMKAPGAIYRAGQALHGALQAEKVPMTRLYRGEGTQRTELPDWLRQSMRDSGVSEAQGRWWTPDKQIADWYVKDAGPGGRRVYQDVPTSVYEKSRVTGKPEARYSLDPENEVFLPKEYVGKGRQNLLDDE